MSNTFFFTLLYFVLYQCPFTIAVFMVAITNIPDTIITYWNLYTDITLSAYKLCCPPNRLQPDRDASTQDFIVRPSTPGPQNLCLNIWYKTSINIQCCFTAALTVIYPQVESANKEADTLYYFWRATAEKIIARWYTHLCGGIPIHIMMGT